MEADRFNRTTTTTVVSLLDAVGDLSLKRTLPTDRPYVLNLLAKLLQPTRHQWMEVTGHNPPPGQNPLVSGMAG